MQLITAIITMAILDATVAIANHHTVEAPQGATLVTVVAPILVVIQVDPIHPVEAAMMDEQFENVNIAWVFTLKAPLVVPSLLSNTDFKSTSITLILKKYRG